MDGLLGFSRAVDRTNTFIARAVSWLILVAVLVSAGNAIIRKVFNTSSNAWLELQWYLYGAAFLLAAAYTLLENEHIRIDIIYGGRSRRTQHWIDLIGHVLFLMPFVILMIWLMVPWLQRSIATGERSMNAGGLILWPAKALLLAGFILLFFQGLSEIIKKIAVMRGVIPDPNPDQSHHAAGEVMIDDALLAETGFAEPTHPATDQGPRPSRATDTRQPSDPDAGGPTDPTDEPSDRSAR
ncbi:MAG: C4-dicarboxylate ABC transporter [Paracoccus denitrificans]|nr:MAG: C4-dicarboxylate ABC transporter [Paracoccus denitrificans]PZO83582.1 MAG: C4-dicarboxylate ABC transporter [Paracoccus denitrificans]